MAPWHHGAPTQLSGVGDHLCQLLVQSLWPKQIGGVLGVSSTFWLGVYLVVLTSRHENWNTYEHIRTKMIQVVTSVVVRKQPQVLQALLTVCVFHCPGPFSVQHSKAQAHRDDGTFQCHLWVTWKFWHSQHLMLAPPKVKDTRTLTPHLSTGYEVVEEVALF